MCGRSPIARNRGTVWLRLTALTLVKLPNDMPSVSVSAIARDWHTSRPYVSRCVNHRDCPTTSLEAARAWRESCASSRAPTNPKQIARLLEEEDNNFKTRAPATKFPEHKTNDPPSPSIDSLHDTLDAAICAQEQAFCLVQEAIGEATDSKMAILLAVHNRALELRLKAESQYREALEHRGISRC